MKIFENEQLEVFEYTGEGYEKTMHYGAWRVAFLNYAERFDKIMYLERHMLTDEIFLLLEGEAKLIIGEEKREYRLEKNKLFNVKRAVWHAVKVSRDAKILIVENHNTATENNEYIHFDAPLTVEL